jgi:hypothetical protein
LALTDSATLSFAGIGHVFLIMDDIDTRLIAILRADARTALAKLDRFDLIILDDLSYARKD